VSENDATAAIASGNLQTRHPSKKRNTGNSCSPSTQAAWVGMELYKKLQDFVGNHLLTVLHVGQLVVPFIVQ
jgi:hypothetical protein